MREFKKTTGRNKRPMVWRTFIDPNDPTYYVVQWGLEDGAIQETKDRPGTCGVDGHSDYQTAEEYAIFCMNREIRKRIEQGYIEYINGKPEGEAACSIDFSKPLPKNLCFYKPKKEISKKLLADLYKNKKAIWTLKRDGMMHITVKRNNKFEIYSRRMDLVTENYPHIIRSLELLDLPNNTILLGEMCYLNSDGTDSFKNVSKICRSKTDLALAYQGFVEFPKRKNKESVIGELSYYVFDVAFYAGRDLISNETVRRRLVILKEIFEVFDDKLTVSTGLKADRDLIIRESKLRERMLRK